MITLEDKRRLVACVVESLEASRRMMAEAAAESSAAATHPESRAEDPKDMRSTEVSYLARGQAMRVEELDEQIMRLRYFEPRAFAEDDSVAAGAVVEVELDDDDDIRWYFVLPYGGGTEVTHAGRTVTIVTGNSPLGRSLLDRCVGDDVELVVRGKKRQMVLARIG